METDETVQLAEGTQNNENSNPNEPPPAADEPTIQAEPTAEPADASAAKREEFVRRSSKSRLSKQSEVEEDEEQSPNSDQSDATIVASSGPVVVHTPDSPSVFEEPEPGTLLVPQHSIESDKSSPTSSNPKVRLVRSQAVENDDLSPSATSDPEPSSSPNPTATLSVSPLKSKYKLGKSSSQSSLSDNGNSPALSRDSSVETQYTDSSGVDLETFIKMTLNKNRNDRVMLLRLETEMISYIKESSDPQLKFQPMTSYHRMLVHRVAAFFGLDHNIDQSGKCVIVNKTANTRLPDFRFSDHVTEECTERDQPKRLLKRDHEGSNERSPDRGLGDKKSKSFEEREEEYEKARRRIFNNDHHDSDTLGVHRGSSSQGSSKEDVRWSGSHKADSHRPWSSTESSGYSTDSSGRRQQMTKASSFPQQNPDDKSWGRLSKADSLSSGASSLSSPQTRPQNSISESASSSQSASSPSQVPAVGSSGQMDGAPPFLRLNNANNEQPCMIWVATSTDQIPLGSLIIDPQTCQPFTNPDGTYYRWQQPPTQPQAQNTMIPPQQSQMQQPTTQTPLPLMPPQQRPYAPQIALQNQQPVLRTDAPRTMDVGAGDLSQQLSTINLNSTMQHQPASTDTHGTHGSMDAQRQFISTQHVQQSQPYVQPQQIQYYNQPPAAAAPQPPAQGVRYMYSQQEASQQSNYGYPVVGLPQQMTVHSVETYQHQPHQQQFNYTDNTASTVPAYYPNGAATSSSPPSQFVCSNAGPQPLFYSQHPRPLMMRAPTSRTPPQTQKMEQRLPTTPEIRQMAPDVRPMPLMRPQQFRAPSPGDPRLVGPSLQLLPNAPRPRLPTQNSVGSNQPSQAKLKNRKSWRSLDDQPLPQNNTCSPCH